ncbi:MAG: hypothetical protein R3C46_07250 [Hyphomonadaceae bacterium]
MQASPLENALYRNSFDDGWLDLVVGAGLVGAGLLWLSGGIVWTAPLPAVLIPLWIAGRNSLIAPRMAEARFRPTREAMNRRMFGGWLLAGVGALAIAAIVFAMARGSDWMRVADARSWAVAIPNVLIGAGLLAGLVLGAKRFALYAAIAIAIGAGGAIAGTDEPGALIAAAGAVVLLVGVVMMVRFMRDHPLNGDDAGE